MTKQTLIDTIAILLSLSKESKRELSKLSVPTLTDIFNNYKKNAMDAQNAIEKEVENARKHALAPRRRKPNSADKRVAIQRNSQKVGN